MYGLLVRQPSAPCYLYQVALVDGDVTKNAGPSLAVDGDVTKSLIGYGRKHRHVRGRHRTQDFTPCYRGVNDSLLCYCSVDFDNKF